MERREYTVVERIAEENLEIQRQILHELRKISRELKTSTHNVTGGTIRRIGQNELATSFPPLGPGVSAKFLVEWTEADGTVDINTLAAQTAWTSSDPTNFPAVIDPSDPTGETADVTIPAGETTTESVTLTVVYTNADGTTASASASFDVVGGVVTPVDVTGGTISRIA